MIGVIVVSERKEKKRERKRKEHKPQRFFIYKLVRMTILVAYVWEKQKKKV
jgi:hypothetical protein